MRENLEINSGLPRLDKIALSAQQRAEVAAERLVVHPEQDLYPKGLLIPTEVMERRRDLQVRGYVMGQPK